MKSETLSALLEDRGARRAAVLLTWLDTGEQRLVHRTDDPHRVDESDAATDPAMREAIRLALRTDRATTFDSVSGRVFIHPYNPPLRLAIIGAVHIAQHLAVLGRTAGYAVSVIDPRTAFATSERFPDVALCHDWPDRGLEQLGLDARCAVVMLSHDPKFDDPALDVALRSESFYIGALGSQRTQARRADRMRTLGFTDADLARIHGPVGLDIGARSPAEIAISIVAEMTQRLRKPDP